MFDGCKEKAPLRGLGSIFEGERADTRGGLSKGLGAFRIGRPLGSDNRRVGKAFPQGRKNLHPGGCGDLCARCSPGFAGDFGGVAIGRAE
jgi:hypothetical protein